MKNDIVNNLDNNLDKNLDNNLINLNNLEAEYNINIHTNTNNTNFLTSGKYVKESFDKLIFLHGNLEYQNFYLSEIEKKFSDNYHENKEIDLMGNEKENENKIKLRKLKKIRKIKNSNINNTINDLFCDDICLNKFFKIFQNPKSFNTNKNKKILKIIKILIDERRNYEKINEIYNSIKQIE
jgi:hypothetical protein